MKRAYHRLITTDGVVHPMVVCQFDDKGTLLSWHALSEEEPQVEWVGGTYKEK